MTERCNARDSHHNNISLPTFTTSKLPVNRITSERPAHNKPPYSSQKLFNPHDNNPNQELVDAYFTQSVTPHPEDTKHLLVNSPHWKKNHGINILTGNNLSFILRSVSGTSLASNKILLIRTTEGLMSCLKVLNHEDCETSGSFTSDNEALLHSLICLSILSFSERQVY